MQQQCSFCARTFKKKELYRLLQIGEAVIRLCMHCRDKEPEIRDHLLDISHECFEMSFLSGRDVPPGYRPMRWLDDDRFPVGALDLSYAYAFSALPTYFESARGKDGDR